MGSILIVDHDTCAQTDLAEYLRSRGHHVEGIAVGSDLAAALAHEDFDVVLADSALAGGEGSALREVLRRYPETVVAVTTPWPSVAEAVELMRAGAYDYLGKPVSPDHIELLLRRVVALRSPRRGFTATPPIREPVLESANSQMVQAISTAHRVAAAADLPILITGESGTGKSLLATLIHRCSPRRAAPFVTVCCAALIEHRLEGTLLEHLDGAIVQTHVGCARADISGTLFFDEIGNVPANCQTKLSHYLEARSGSLVGDGRRELSARVIAATRHDPKGEVESGRLRGDLFHQLAVVTIALPPLRERKEDLPKLSEHFLAQMAARYGRDTIELTAEAEQVLARYDWPGNVRELQSVLERAVVLTDGSRIGAEDLFAGPLDPVPQSQERPARPALR